MYKRRPLWLLVTIVAFQILSALTTALPTGPEYTPIADEETATTDFLVDASQFAHLLSTHLLFDHVENAFHLLSKQISSRFRESIQVNVRLQSPVQYEDTTYSSVDVQILKGQLNGAVGSYIEDKLPTVWGRYTAALDKSTLQAYIENVLGRLCAPNDVEVGFVSSQCLEQHAGQFLSLVDRYVGNHVKRTMSDITSHELPSLFDMTRTQVEQILSHFNTHVLSDSRLKLVLATDHDGIAPADSSTEMNQILETAGHWEMPSQEDNDKSDDDNILNNSSSSSYRFTRETMVQAVQHFAKLARHSVD